MDGEREVLGMWFQANEGAKFWMGVLIDLKQRGVQDILIACVDGLKGFPAARKLIYLAIGNRHQPAAGQSHARVQDPLRRPTTRLTTPNRLHRKRTPSSC